MRSNTDLSMSTVSINCDLKGLNEPFSGSDLYENESDCQFSDFGGSSSSQEPDSARPQQDGIAGIPFEYEEEETPHRHEASRRGRVRFVDKVVSAVYYAKESHEEGVYDKNQIFYNDKDYERFLTEEAIRNARIARARKRNMKRRIADRHRVSRPGSDADLLEESSVDDSSHDSREARRQAASGPEHVDSMRLNKLRLERERSS